MSIRRPRPKSTSDRDRMYAWMHTSESSPFLFSAASFASALICKHADSVYMHCMPFSSSRSSLLSSSRSILLCFSLRLRQLLWRRKLTSHLLMRSFSRSINSETTLDLNVYTAGRVVSSIQMPAASQDCCRNAREFAEMTRFSTCTNRFFDIFADRPIITGNQLQVKPIASVV
jgi:hypothetical protein